MKIRTDFVTNSSSSSFIFGEPNGNKLKISDVVELVRGIAKEILGITNELDTLVRDYDRINDLVHKIRNTDNYSEKYDALDEIKKEKWLLSWIQDKLKESKSLEVGDDPDYAEELLECYAEDNQYQMGKIKEIAESTDKWSLPINSEIVQFSKKSSNAEEYADDVISWYMYDSGCEELKDKSRDRSISRSEIAHKYLGEIAIMGECGYIPSLIVSVLCNKTTYGCDHMG